MNKIHKRAMTALAALVFMVHQHGLAEPVLTYHNDNARTGVNPHETRLTLANVNTNHFGRLLKYEVDGYVYAQPLYFPALSIPGRGQHNAVFAATENNSVYAFDADSNAGPEGGLLWHASLGNGIDIVTIHEFGGRYHNNVYQDMLPRVGITGTPVIDPATGTLFVDAFTREAGASATNYHHTVHALNITNGAEQPFGPVEVTASVAGGGVGSVNHILKFDARQHQQRPALTLAGGILYVAYGSAADTDTYHGWVIGFDARNLRPLPNYVFNTTPNATREQFGANAGEAALWMGGGGLCVDANTNLYFEVANGSFSADPSLGNGVDYGDSFMKLSTAGGRLSVADFFTPFDQKRMQEQDADFGSGAPLLLPDEAGSAAHPHLIVGGDKGSKIYLVDRDNMGHYRARDNHQIVQEVNAGVGQIFSTPAYFDFHLYYQGIGGVLKAFAISNGFINPAPTSATRTSFGGFGTTPSISANGQRDAIVWTIQSDGAVRQAPAILHAYNATNLAVELYNSGQMLERDNPGIAVKMTVPTVADGKVFVGTQNALSVFGLGSFRPAPALSPVPVSPGPPPGVVGAAPANVSQREKVAAFLNMPPDFFGSLPPLLSQTGAFSDTPRRMPAAGLIPYVPNAPSWSDGAVKSRYMAVPYRGGVIAPGEQIQFRPTHSWSFPAGTVFVQNFDLVVNQTNTRVPLRRLETQLLVRDILGAVYGVTYKWRPDNSEADLLSTSATEDILITNANGVSTQTWYYASPADCLMCHTPVAGYVLGVSTRQLNGNFTDPATGQNENQLRALNRLGLFTPALDETSVAHFTKLSALTDLSASLEARARSYLDANCANCHQPGGVGNFDARYETPAADQHIVDAPAAVSLGIDHARIVKPMDTAGSVLYQRMLSLAPAVKMPPLARNQVDKQAAQVISDWIKSLPVKHGE